MPAEIPKSFLTLQLEEHKRSQEAVESRKSVPRLEQYGSNPSQATMRQTYKAGSQASNSTKGY
jgi:hypothetical protein